MAAIPTQIVAYSDLIMILYVCASLWSQQRERTRRTSWRANITMARCVLSQLLQTIREIESEDQEMTSNGCCAYRYNRCVEYVVDVILTVNVKLRHNWELECAVIEELY